MLIHTGGGDDLADPLPPPPRPNHPPTQNQQKVPLGKNEVLNREPPCPGNNEVLKKYGPNRSVRWTPRSVPSFGTETRSLTNQVPKNYGLNGSVCRTRHSLDTQTSKVAGTEVTCHFHG